MLRGLFWLALLAGAIYIGVQYGRPFVRGWRFKDAITQSARFARAEPDSSLQRALLESAQDLGVPISAADLRIRRDDDGNTEITAAWEEIVDVRAWKVAHWVDTLRFTHVVVDGGSGVVP